MLLINLQKQVELPSTFSEALMLAAELQREKELNAPKIDSYDKFIDAKSLQSFKDVAGLLNIGRNKLTARLRELKIITNKNIPYQRYLDMKLFEVKQSTQNGFNTVTTYTTSKGIEYIKNKLN